jgi:hypothetical protein
MKKAQKHALARIVRRQAILFAELPLLESMLDTYQSTKTAPTNWKQARKDLRDSETYQKILQEFEPMISALESASDDDDLIPLLQKIADGKLPN